MKLIKPSFEILLQSPGLEGVYKQIEIAGRTCYKSFDKITPDSAKDFVDRMIASGHGAMLEHGTVYLQKRISDNDDFFDKWIRNKYSITYIYDADPINFIFDIYVTTNYRVLVENGWLDDLQYICEPTKFHEKRVSVHFLLDRGVTHEYVRNRGKDGNAFAQESTRYCNYISEKFGGSISYCIPVWLKDDEKEEFISDLIINENQYFKWINKGWKAQQARGFLNHFLKSELILTGTISDWQHFFELRDADAAHPSARELAKPLHELFIENGWI